MEECIIAQVSHSLIPQCSAEQEEHKRGRILEQVLRLLQLPVLAVALLMLLTIGTNAISSKLIHTSSQACCLIQNMPECEAILSMLKKLNKTVLHVVFSGNIIVCDVMLYMQPQ